jgi:PhnB protein
MMRLNPHLAFDGRCAAAFEFYEKCLGGKIVTMLTYGDSPMAGQTPPGWRNKVLHATLALGDHVLTGADVIAEQYQKPQGFSVLLQVDAVAEAERIFKTLAENGVVQVPLEETFWASRFGMVVDQFGTPWMINCGNAA